MCLVSVNSADNVAFGGKLRALVSSKGNEKKNYLHRSINLEHTVSYL